MPNLSHDVWIGAALSVPISIATGLAIDPIRRWYGARGKTKEAARRALLEGQYKQAIMYRIFPHRLTQFLIYYAIRIALYSV